jgi:hypothetical protein
MVELAPPGAELIGPVESIDLNGPTVPVADSAQTSDIVARLRAGGLSFASFEQLFCSCASAAASTGSPRRLFQPFVNGMGGSVYVQQTVYRSIQRQTALRTMLNRKSGRVRSQ